MGHGARVGLGAEIGGGGGGNKPRPPSVPLCAAIGESSKDDCTSDGHLQATIIPFVLSLPLR